MKYHIITIGCQMNKSDSERVAGYLEENNFKKSDKRNQADLVVINTCGVRQSAEDRVYGLIPRIKKENPGAKIILTGCLSERKDVRKRLKNNVDSWLPINNLPKLTLSFPGYMSETRVGGARGKKNKGNSDYLKIKPKYQSKFSAFVPIGNGCNNYCAYCVVPYARGREVYRPVEEILSEVKNLINKGYKEIILIAQNVNSYKSGGFTFPHLIKKVNNVSGNFCIRFATSHPKDMSDELIKTVAKCEKICEHIHLPVQAGDDEVLEDMNRKYTIKHYKHLINKIRNKMPEASITTDVIVGFPGEAKEQFNNTVKLFKKIKFDMAYIAQYSPRPGTAAAELDDDVPKAEKKRREEELMQVLRKTALENNKKYVGKIVEVLVEGKNRKGEWFGKTRTYKNVKFKNSNSKFKSGGFLKVKITNAEDFGLYGVIK